jgi:hypothetical protein
MAVPIQDAHKFIRSILKKNKGGFASPADIDMYLNRAVSDWISAIVFKFKKTKHFDYDHLLTKRTTLPVTFGNGILDLPSDYLEGLTVYLSVNSNSNIIEGTLYNWDQFLEVTNSKIITPTTSYPAATIFIDNTNAPKIQFAPVPSNGDTYNYTLVYVKKPATAFYAYTVDSNGNISDAATMNSKPKVDLDISDRFLGDIYVRTLLYLGVTLDNPVLIQTEQIKDGNQRNDER